MTQSKTGNTSHLKHTEYESTGMHNIYSLKYSIANSEQFEFNFYEENLNYLQAKL